MNKTLYYVIIVILILGSFYYMNTKYSLENVQKEMLDEQKDQSYRGIIIKKYTEENGRHSDRILKLSNGTIAEPIRMVWDKTTLGDSIVKIKGADYVTIYKKNDSIITYNYTKWINEIPQ